VAKTICIIQGHPDPAGGHFCHALASAYAEGAAGARHRVTTVDVGQLEFPMLRRREDWQSSVPPASLRKAQAAIGAADHLLVVFPLWMGDMPAVLKGFFEQVLRPGFALGMDTRRKPFERKLLRGKSARVVVTMGMPAAVYRWYFRAHSVKSLERNILGFCGVSPVNESLVGPMEGMSAPDRAKWLARMRSLGLRAE